MTVSMIVAPRGVEGDRRPRPQAPEASLWLEWLRRSGDARLPRRRHRPEPYAGAIGHRGAGLEVLGGTASGAATTPPALGLGAPE